MFRSRRTLPLAVLFLVAAPLAALPDGAPEVPEPERRARVAEWRKHPREYARLLQDTRAFLALPEEQQERLRRLDRELHRQESSTQAHLFDVLRRYADWLERLPAPERRQVLDAPDRRLRLKKVRELREAQWLRRQPLAVRERVARLHAAGPAVQALAAARWGVLSPQTGAGLSCTLSPFLAAGDPRSLLIASLRQGEHRRRQEWQIALRHWERLIERRPLPSRLSDFDEAVERYVREYLGPMLSRDEQERLEKAEGQWPLFVYTLVELADRHPPALPGPHGPTTFQKLPTDVQDRIRKAALKGKGEVILQKAIKSSEGRWPGFALAMAGFASRRKASLPNELWPSKLGDLSPGMQEFVTRKLRPKLDADEKKQLAQKEGKWPEYPVLIQELAARHYLQVPWQTLPGPRERWDPYRFKPQAGVEGFPALPRHKLRDFARVELTPHDRAALRLSDADPSMWGRLTEEYFRRKPDEQRKLRQHDAEHRKSGGPFLSQPGSRPARFGF